MKPIAYYNTRSIAYGLQPNEFADLDQQLKGKLLRLMARLSERSYRRGVEQGLACCPEVARKMRYERSLDSAPRVEDARSIFMSAVDMLLIQNGEIRDIGLVPKVYKGKM